MRREGLVVPWPYSLRVRQGFERASSFDVITKVGEGDFIWKYRMEIGFRTLPTGLFSLTEEDGRPWIWSEVLPLSCLWLKGQWPLFLP